MRTPRLPLRLLALLPWAAMAQTPIHRCTDSNGNPVFTDRTCADLQATPTRPDAPASAAGSDVQPPILCAADMTQLKQGVIEAFASGNVNRLAGLMLWNGYGQRAAVADIRALQARMRRPLVDIDVTPPDQAVAAIPPQAGLGDDSPLHPARADIGAPATGTAPELVLHTAADDGSGIAQETRFAVVRHAGCLWLRQP